MKKLLMLFLLACLLACNGQTSQSNSIRKDTKVAYNILLTAHNEQRGLNTDEKTKVDAYLEKYNDSKLKTSDKLLVEYIKRMELTLTDSDSKLFTEASVDASDLLQNK